MSCTGPFTPFTPLEIMPRCSLRARSPSLRAGGLSEPEAGAEPGPNVMDYNIKGMWDRKGVIENENI